MKKSVLISKREIDKRVKELAKQISIDYKGKDLIVVGILKGSFIFLSDLIRKIKVPCIIDFMQLSSYGSNTISSTEVRIISELKTIIKGKDVLIVEDIIDSGLTMAFLSQYLNVRDPKSIKVCTLLNKKERRTIPFTPDYIGFDIPNEFVIGYGLDFDEKYRSLPYISKVEKI